MIIRDKSFNTADHILTSDLKNLDEYNYYKMETYTELGKKECACF